MKSYAMPFPEAEKSSPGRLFRRLTAVLILISIPAVFSGCAEVKETNDMAILSGMSVDVDASGRWEITAEVVNKTADASPEETRRVIRSNGSTLGDALENLNFQDSRQIYFSHAKTLVLSRYLAETQGVGPVADYVMRNYKTRLSMDLLVSDLPDASAVADLSSSSSGLIYYDLEELVKTDRQYGACSPTKVYQAVNLLKESGADLTIPLISQRDDRACLAGTAVFSGDRMTGSLDQDETLYLQLLQDHLENAHLVLPEENMTFQVMDADASFRPVVSGGKPALNVDLKLSCTLSQAGRTVTREDTETLSEKLSQLVRSRCSALITKAQHWDADIFGFGKSMGGLTYDFSALPVTVNCEINLKLGEVHR